jgi:hypothetical protein
MLRLEPMLVAAASADRAGCGAPMALSMAGLWYRHVKDAVPVRDFARLPGA